MPETSLYRLTHKDIPRAVACLKDAFMDDPLWTDVFKEVPNRDEALTGFFACPLVYGIKYGQAFAASPDMEAVAVWVPGKYAHMSFWRMLRCGALAYGAKMGSQPMRRLALINKQITPDRQKHMKNKPYMYLMIIGVSASSQGKGLGSRLLNAVKQECMRNSLYLYLETETQPNVRFYEKHGFSVLQKIIIEKLGLPMWEMVHNP